MVRSNRGTKAQGRVKKTAPNDTLNDLLKIAVSDVNAFWRTVEKVEINGKTKSILLITRSQSIRIGKAPPNFSLAKVVKGIKGILLLRQLLTKLRKDDESFIQILDVVGNDPAFILDHNFKNRNFKQMFHFFTRLEREQAFAESSIDVMELIELLLKEQPSIGLVTKLKRVVRARNARSISMAEIKESSELTWLIVEGHKTIDLEKVPRIREIIFDLHVEDAYSAIKAIPPSRLPSVKYEIGEFIKREKKKLGIDYNDILKKIFLRDFSRENIFLDPLITFG